MEQVLHQFRSSILDIYTHDDFDGLVSAIVLLWATYDKPCAKRDREIDNIAFAVPQKNSPINLYTLLKEKKEGVIRAVLDLGMGGDFWSDHHYTNYPKATHFETIDDILTLFDPQANSCADVLFRGLADKKRSDYEKIKKLVEAANKQDGGLLTENEILAPDMYGKIANAMFYDKSDHNFFRYLIRQMLDKNIEEVIEDQEVKGKYESAIGSKLQKYVQAETDGCVSSYLDGRLIVVDSRFQGYHFTDPHTTGCKNPGSEVVIIVTGDEEEANVSIYKSSVFKGKIKRGEIKYQDFLDLPLNAIAKKYGGGGHTDACGCGLKSNLVSQLIKDVEELMIPISYSN